MMVLDQLLDDLREAGGPIRSHDLARRIGVSDSALSGMIGVLAAKGVLVAPVDAMKGESAACSGAACGTTCVGLGACPFVAQVPETYALAAPPALAMPG